MVETMEWIVEKKEYVIPTVDLYRLNETDIVRTSPGDEGNDNDFGAAKADFVKFCFLKFYFFNYNLFFNNII